MRLVNEVTVAFDTPKLAKRQWGTSVGKKPEPATVTQVPPVIGPKDGMTEVTEAEKIVAIVGVVATDEEDELADDRK